MVVLFGTLIQTGTGFIHGVNERLSSAFQAHNREFPDWIRPVVAIVFLLASLALSSVGIIGLVSKGYSMMSWGIFLVYVLPLLTVGVYKLAKKAAD